MSGSFFKFPLTHGGEAWKEISAWVFQFVPVESPTDLGDAISISQGEGGKPLSNRTHSGKVPTSLPRLPPMRNKLA